MLLRDQVRATLVQLSCKHTKAEASVSYEKDITYIDCEECGATGTVDIRNLIGPTTYHNKALSHELRKAASTLADRIAWLPVRQRYQQK
jgi:transcription elongation factor Elf1